MTSRSEIFKRRYPGPKTEKEQNVISGLNVGLEIPIQWIELPSVGAAITLDGITYPIQTNGVPDFDMDVHLNDIELEWIDALSTIDKEIVYRIKRRL